MFAFSFLKAAFPMANSRSTKHDPCVVMSYLYIEQSIYDFHQIVVAGVFVVFNAIFHHTIG